MADDDYTTNTRGAKRYRFDEEARIKRERKRGTTAASPYPSATTVVIGLAALLVFTGLII